MIAGKVVGLGFEIISKLDINFLMTVIAGFFPVWDDSNRIFSTV